MGRPLRGDYEGAWHHVMNRGTARTMLFRSDRDRRAFLSLLGDIEPRFGVRVVAFVLMGNHYHLVVQSLAGRLAEAMHFVDGRFAQYFNRVHERDGAFFRGRYSSVPIKTDGQLERVGIYVHLNPVVGGLIERSVDYRWSSLRSYVCERAPTNWLHLDLLRGRSGGDYLRTVLSYSEEVAALAAPIDDPASDWCAGDTDEADDHTAVAASDAAVAEAFDVSVDELYAVARGRQNLPRLVAIAAARTCGPEASEVATRYGLRNASGVRSVVQRLRRLADGDDELVDRLRTLGIEL